MPKLKEVELYYPILVTDNITLQMKIGKCIWDLLHESKAVSVNGPIHCNYTQLSIHDAEATISLEEGCFLTSIFKRPGVSRFQIWMTNSDNRTAQVSIFLKVEEFISRILLGKIKVEYELGANSTHSSIDLIQACLVVAFPEMGAIRCYLNDYFQDNRLNLTLCQLAFDFREDSSPVNVSINFAQETVNKSCTILFSASDNNTQMPLSLALGTNQTLENGYYHYGNKGYLIGPSWKKESMPIDSNEQNFQQFGRLLLIPFIQGIFEAEVDRHIASIYLQSLIKLSFRLALIYYSSSNILGMGILGMASIFEAGLKKGVLGKTKWLERLSLGTLLLILAEMEYAFADLWYLAGKPLFFRSLWAKLNCFFGNQVVYPGIKTIAYLLTLELDKRCFSKVAEARNHDEETLPSGALLLNQNEKGLSAKPLSFFSATKKAAGVVFSRKIERVLPTFFRSVGEKGEHSRSSEPASQASLIESSLSRG